MSFRSRVANWLSQIVLFLCGLVTASACADDQTLQIVTPKPHQVIQRIGVAPGAGYANVEISGILEQSIEDAEWEFCIVPAMTNSNHETNWNPLKVVTRESNFKTSAKVPAGGWYRLEIHARFQNKVLALGSIEPIGVGEVFLVAGQSYASNCNDEHLAVT